MQYILTEEQHQLILTEGFKDAVEDRLKKAYDFTKDTINKTTEQFGKSFRFAMTYGAGIGAFKVHTICCHLQHARHSQILSSTRKPVLLSMLHFIQNLFRCV